MGKRKLRVHRKGYYRRPYIRKGGIKVKGTYVPPATYTIEDRGAPGRGKKIITDLKEGRLKKYGYSIDKPAEERRKALAKAVEEYGAERVWHMLHAQVVLRKNAKKGSEEAKHRERLRKDRDWIKKVFKPDLTPYRAIKARWPTSEMRRV